MQRRCRTDPKVIDPKREVISPPVSIERKKAIARAKTLSVKKARSLSVQDVRNMVADEVHRHVPAIIERMCLMARGDLDPPMSSQELQAANALVDRILPRLQGLAIRGEVNHQVVYKWKD